MINVSDVVPAIFIHRTWGMAILVILNAVVQLDTASSAEKMKKVSSPILAIEALMLAPARLTGHQSSPPTNY